MSDGEHLTRAGSTRIGGGGGLVGAASASTVCSLNQSDYFSDMDAVAGPALMPLYPGGRVGASPAGTAGASRAMRQQDAASAAGASSAVGVGAQGGAGAESELERTLRAGDADEKATSEAAQCHQRVPSDQTDPDRFAYLPFHVVLCVFVCVHIPDNE